MFVAIDVIEQRFFGAVGEIHAAHRNGHHVRAGGRVRARHFLKAAIFSRADNEPRVESAARDYQLVCHLDSPRITSEIVPLQERPL